MQSSSLKEISDLEILSSEIEMEQGCSKDIPETLLYENPLFEW